MKKRDTGRFLEKGIESSIRTMTDKRESLMSPLAATSADAIRRHNRVAEDIRIPWSRDADRNIHTRAYTHYIDKTQVFYLVENDHITHSVIHVQLVSKIARTIGRDIQAARTYIYNNEKLTRERPKIERMYATLFETYLADLEAGRRDSKIVSDFLQTGWASPRYLEAATNAELVRDFIAGMTDRYFAKRFEECVIPRRVEAKFT